MYSDIPLTPSVNLIKEFEWPAGAGVAGSLTNCVRITPKIPTPSYDYVVGSSTTNSSESILIQNITTNAKLKIQITGPSYMKVTPTKEFVLDPQQSYKITFDLDKAAADALTLQKKYNNSDNYSIVVSLYSKMTEPIYVPTNA